MSLFAGLAQIGSTLINSQVDKSNTDKTIQANRNLAEYQYSKDVEMWNKQNAYNSPVEQMARFKQAGLNPNLIYGQGSAGNATQLPKYQAPTAQYNYSPPINPASALSAFQDFTLKQAQIDNVKANTNNTDQRTLTEQAMTFLQGLRGKQLSAGQDWWTDNAMKQNLKLGGELDLLGKKRQLTGYQADAQKTRNRYLDQIFIKQLATAQSVIDRNVGATALLGTQQKIAGKQLDTYNLGVAGKLAPGILNFLRLLNSNK